MSLVMDVVWFGLLNMLEKGVSLLHPVTDFGAICPPE